MHFFFGKIIPFLHFFLIPVVGILQVSHLTYLAHHVPSVQRMFRSVMPTYAVSIDISLLLVIIIIMNVLN